ncbi:lactonase family protein [Vibrio sp. RE88]|uniref:lactonase family protein n=1 Tax=Vibrio sp. RE88 TaxID=2607610 RepID=UPI001493B8E4|nr:lactonase family protein [Vibrio sp. RE88]NOH60602.1 lactonase family protein [Vibrio sp. RE88]
MKASNHLHFYVGTYTDDPSQSQGIAQVSLNTSSGELTRLDDAMVIRNPSYLTHTSSGLYTFSEVSRSDSTALVFQSDARSGVLAIEGDYPCHIDVDCQQRYVAVANYGSGNVNVYVLDGDGKPLKLVADLFVDGKGANSERQQSPHAHQVQFLNHTPQLAVVDLGSDSLHLYDIDTQSDHFQLHQTVSLPPGCGPRHLVMNGDEDMAYVVCELAETLITLTKEGSHWRMVDQCDLLPGQPKGEAAAAIKLSCDERFIYVSCRQQNAISIFELVDGLPSWLAAQDCQGQFPRDFTLSSDGNWLIVANQHSNNLASYLRCQSTGLLSPANYQCQIDAPVCLIEH